jgi:hypothetical protein
MGSPRHLSTTIIPKPEVTFERLLKNIFAADPLTLNTLLTAMPLFLWSLRDGSWDVVQALVEQAHTSLLITTDQYNNIRLAGIEAATPMTLEIR